MMNVFCHLLVNPSVKLYDAQTLNKAVSNESVAFHELAEAQGRVENGSNYRYAHANAFVREKNLLSQRPNFTYHLAGSAILAQRKLVYADKQLKKELKKFKKRLRKYNKQLRKSRKRQKP